MSLKKTILTLPPLFILFSFMQMDTPSLTIQKVADSFEAYMNNLSLQKIYIHTDKEQYFAGEKIWIKAYLLNGITNTPDLQSDHVYVELVNPYEKVSQLKRIRISKGLGAGNFELKDTVPEGVYQIRSYTNWMKNSGPEFFFSRNISIRNAAIQYQITDKEVKANKKKLRNLNKETKKYWFNVFPEGGNLLEGIDNKIAFKAEDSFGKGIRIKGTVYDSKKKVIAKLKTLHNGMGVFNLIAEAEEKYTAQIEFPDGSTKKYIIPEAKKNAIGLAVTNTDNTIHISINSNKTLSNDRSANKFIVVGHVSGKIYYISSINLLDNKHSIDIPITDFPSGIIHFTLINNRLIAVSERLIFTNQRDNIHFEIKKYEKTDSLHFHIVPQVSFETDEIFSGSLAMTIPDHSIDPQMQQNIISELLLNSDLPGYIEEPRYYFESNNDSVSQHADLLMLTHGWKRFLWDDVLSQNPPSALFEKEKGITLLGKITREFLEIPLENVSVILQIRNKYNDEFSTLTDSKGFFYFNQLYYPDTINVKLLARKENGAKNLIISLEKEIPSKVIGLNGNFFLTTTSKLNKKIYRQEKAALAKKEFIRNEEKLDSIFATNIYGTPDFVVWGKDFPPGQSNLLDALHSRVPGLNIVGNDVTIRGRNSILLDSKPLLVIDGVTTSFDVIRSVSVEDVERVDILKGPKSAFYGARGANGVIAIYTKRGTFAKKGELYFSMLGYQTVEQFNAPSSLIKQERIKNNELPMTVYWNPMLEFTVGKALTIVVPKGLITEEVFIVLEGITNRGRVGYTSVSFQ